MTEDSFVAGAVLLATTCDVSMHGGRQLRKEDPLEGILLRRALVLCILSIAGNVTCLVLSREDRAVVAVLAASDLESSPAQ
jgi:hypothetical protein